jgi:signal transduction histidine kinase
MARSTVSQFGLRRALEDLAASIEVPGRLEVELSTFGLDERMDPKIELALYRMVQESVSNALKHARADHLSIQLTRNAGGVNLLVEDNGRGFDPQAVKEGMGMGNLRARAAEFQGVVNVDSKAGRGTIVSIDIPLA